MRGICLACLALLAVLPPFAVHGQQPTSITLSCGGAITAPDYAKSDPITGGWVIVDLEERTVTFNSFRLPVESADGAIVIFHGEQTTSYEGLRLTIDGSIDLGTGGVSVTFEQVGNHRTWKLTCPPLGLF
jgi:hypothetical protein